MKYFILPATALVAFASGSNVQLKGHDVADLVARDTDPRTMVIRAVVLVSSSCI
jgi:hypothetical protein